MICIPAATRREPAGAQQAGPGDAARRAAAPGRGPRRGAGPVGVRALIADRPIASSFVDLRPTAADERRPNSGREDSGASSARPAEA